MIGNADRAGRNGKAIFPLGANAAGGGPHGGSRFFCGGMVGELFAEFGYTRHAEKLLAGARYFDRWSTLARIFYPICMSLSTF